MAQNHTAISNRKMQLVANESAAIAELERRNTRQVKATLPIKAHTAAEKRIQAALNAIPLLKVFLAARSIMAIFISTYALVK